MLHYEWKIDDKNLVKVSYYMSGRIKIHHNDREVFNKINMRFRRAVDFHLEDEQKSFAQVSFCLRYLTIPVLELKLDGKLVPPSSVNGRARACSKCNAPAGIFDQFCDGCGGMLPGTEEAERQASVKSGSAVIWILAVMFALFGLIMWGLSENTAKKALRQLDELDASQIVPKKIGGETYTVGQLREQIKWEPKGVLLINLILSAIMVGLGIWSRKSPLAAIVTAATVYLVVIVGNAIASPETIAQGIILKVIFLSIFASGIKSALKARKGQH